MLTGFHQRRPCYEGLKNNVPTSLLTTSLNPFPPGTPDYTTHDVLERYIQDTARKAGVEQLILYDTAVNTVEKKDSVWMVETSTLREGSEQLRTWVCARFSTPDGLI